MVTETMPTTTIMNQLTIKYTYQSPSLTNIYQKFALVLIHTLELPRNWPNSQSAVICTLIEALRKKCYIRVKGCCDQNHSMASCAWKATQRHCGFKKPLVKPQERETRFKLPTGYIPEPKEKSRSIDNRSIDLLLAEVCRKLEMVKMERYIMRQQAKIEGCKKGLNWRHLKHLEWFDYSDCLKKYT